MKHAARFSFFFVLAILAWWTITSDYSQTSKLLPDDGKQFAEVFMHDFSMTAMNEEGRPNYLLDGAYLQRNTGSHDTRIEQPVFQMLKQNDRWKIIADEAIFNDHHETIQLKSNVVMQQQGADSAVTIRTDYLFINTRTQIASTKSPIELTRGRSRLQSTGMIYNNNTSKLELTSNVNGYYFPHD